MPENSGSDIPPEEKKTSRKAPSFQFYPADWLKDPELSRCSHAERGFYIDLLCVLHYVQKIGRFSTNDIPWTEKEIAKSVRGNPYANQILLCKLLLKNVLKIAPDGTIYSARMVRDEIERTLVRERMRRFRNANVTVDVTRSERPSSSSSSILLQTPLTPLSGGNNKPAFSEVQCGSAVITVQNKGRRLWTESQRAALVGGRIEDYLEFFRRRGFHAEIKSAG